MTMHATPRSGAHGGSVRCAATDQSAHTYRAPGGSKGDSTGASQDTVNPMTMRYLSLQGVADHLGVSRSSVAKYNLPEPDVIVGDDLNARRGWSVETIDQWNASRPGPGNWGKRGSKEKK